jgi:hypothetical protein
LRGRVAEQPKNKDAQLFGMFCIDPVISEVEPQILSHSPRRPRQAGNAQRGSGRRCLSRYCSNVAIEIILTEIEAELHSRIQGTEKCGKS